jgi:hypothetical protein
MYFESKCTCLNKSSEETENSDVKILEENDDIEACFEEFKRKNGPENTV